MNMKRGHALSLIRTLTVVAALSYAGAACAGAAAPIAAGGTAAPDPRTPPVSTAAPDPASPAADMRVSVPIYDRDYPFIDYGGTPVHNQVARLLEKLRRGGVQLKYEGKGGYLASLLAALDIDPASQVLVFSKTSLQIDHISPQTPRAVYFNDDTYIGYVQESGFMEVATMDADRGAVFYGFNTMAGEAHGYHLDREAQRCLSCHDTFAESGGGVPDFMFESAYDLRGTEVIFGDSAHETAADTPIEERWGGWYVTGTDGGAFSLGNVLPPEAAGTVIQLPRSKVYRGAQHSLTALFDPSPYLTGTSDIVALLVLQHEVAVHNAMIHAYYKCRYLLAADSGLGVNAHWRELPAPLQARMAAVIEPLAVSFLMADAAPLAAPVAGDSGYAEHFQARGPRDPARRSLRELELRTRLFKYPMSYLVYSESFDALPVSIRERLYARFFEVLSGRDRSGPYAKLGTAERTAALEILRATKPDFALAAVRTD